MGEEQPSLFDEERAKRIELFKEDLQNGLVEEFLREEARLLQERAALNRMARELDDSDDR